MIFVSKEIVWKSASFVIGILNIAIIVYVIKTVPDNRLNLFEKKKENADSIIMYELRNNEVLKFNVKKGDEVFYVVSHCILEGKETQKYDPLLYYQYGINVKYINGEGKLEYQKEYYEKTRQSKNIKTKDGWEEENSFLKPNEGELTDDRITVIRTKNVLNNGGSVVIQNINKEYPLLIRIYKLMFRTDYQKLKRFNMMNDYQKNRIATYMGLKSLAELSITDLWSLFENKWSRIEAESLAGEIIKKRRIYYTGYRLQDNEKDESINEIESEKAIALNYFGPATIEIIAKKINCEIGITTISKNEIAPKEIIYKLNANEKTAYKLKDELQTVVIRNKNKYKSASIRIKINQKDYSPVGLMQTVKLGSPKKIYYSIPDISQQEASMVSGNDNELFVSIIGIKKNDVLRLDVRAIMEKEKEERQIEIKSMDVNNNIVMEQNIGMEFSGSLFEKVNNSILDRYRYRWVSDSKNIYVNKEDSQKTIRIKSNLPISARALIYQNNAKKGNDYYPSPGEDKYWRYKKEKSSNWHQIEFENWKDIIQQKRQIKIYTQARIEKKEIRDEEKKNQITSWNKLETKGDEEAVLLYEKVEEQDLKNEYEVYIKCPQGKNIVNNMEDDPEDNKYGVLEMTYYVPESMQLGGVINIYQNENKLKEHKILTRKDSIRIRRIDKNAAIQWKYDNRDSGDKLPLVFITTLVDKNKRIKSYCDIYKTYEIYPIEKEGNRVFNFKKKDKIKTINTVAYSERLEKLEMELDDGVPNRERYGISEDYTSSNKEIIIGEGIEKDIWMPSNQMTKIEVSDTIFYRIGNDLKRNWHKIKVKNKGGKVIWIRMFEKEDEIIIKEGMKVKKVI